MIKGIGASSGIAIAKAYKLVMPDLTVTQNTVEDVAAEIKKFEDCMAETAKQLEAIKEAAVFDAHALVLQDPELKTQVLDKINNEKLCAEAALDAVANSFIAMFEMMDDDYFRERAADIKDVSRRLLANLLGKPLPNPALIDEEVVIIADDLTPSDTAQLNKNLVRGFATNIGGRTSHSAIMARSLEIPAVVACKTITEEVKDGDLIVLDGIEGTVMINPDEATVKEYETKRAEFIAYKEELKKLVNEKTITTDGHQVELVANIGSAKDLAGVKENGGEGVGLFRTEFLFMDRDSVPTEEEQFEAYKSVAETMKGKPVIIRTLDIGGDKAIPYLGLEEEENPFLGFRAIRYCLQRTDLYKAQLRALVRASAFGKIKIMVPLVTCVDELRSVKAMVADIMKELDGEGIAYNKNLEIGVMMETSAACMIADILAKEAAFFSIGTNDLTGYTMAVDRGNAKVAYLYSTYQPAVLRSIKRIIECGKKEGIMVGMCGEAAADPKLIPLLLAFGLDEFSVSATSVLKTRKTISNCTVEECKALADKVMQCNTEEEVLDILK